MKRRARESKSINSCNSQSPCVFIIKLCNNSQANSNFMYLVSPHAGAALPVEYQITKGLLLYNKYTLYKAYVFCEVWWVHKTHIFAVLDRRRIYKMYTAAGRRR